ncbi:hypothetical protein [Cesiribacter andamanensis]|uniref:Tellurite resistance protein TehB n=1 Tax=Cesiribacter andamanensis AMV16 TaxID=1279009 RepID=M7NLF5_9BACT|nr:hypothetical protein [Cesiribacter andamanensis]EMR02620.1 hypothetical protein ADICEAN_02219 [Cesiribacter andamanensis AMV16]
MPTVSDSGKADYYGLDPHPFFKRVIDRLPAGRLLLVGEVAGRYATYATEAGWQVHTLVFDAEDKQRTDAQLRQEQSDSTSSLYQAGQPLCPGQEFDAAILLFVQLPQEARRPLHHALIECLSPQGGNLYLLAYSQNQPQGTRAPMPQIRYSEKELVDDFKGLQIDLLQEEEEKIPATKELVKLLQLSAVRNLHHSSDSVSLSLKG